MCSRCFPKFLSIRQSVGLMSSFLECGFVGLTWQLPRAFGLIRPSFVSETSVVLLEGQRETAGDGVGARAGRTAASIRMS